MAAVDRVVAASSIAEAVHRQRHEALVRSLEEFRALLAASATQMPPAGPLLVGVVPLAADCFQEREAAARLETVLADGRTAVLTGSSGGDESGWGSGVLSGMGGVGKTQLAAAYARRTLAQGTPVVVWVTATTRQAVVDAYARAAAALRLDGYSGDDPETDARCFLSWTATTGRAWLVVLDDVQDQPTAEVAHVHQPARRHRAAGRGTAFCGQPG